MMNAECGMRNESADTATERVEELRSEYGRMEIPSRGRAFALRIIRLYRSLSHHGESEVIGKQFLRSGTSVGAHLHEARRARTVAEMLSKVEVALQELEETDYWLLLLIEADIVPAERLSDLRDELQQIVRILVKSASTLRRQRS